jgi:hypothetical protein
MERRRSLKLVSWNSLTIGIVSYGGLENPSWVAAGDLSAV